MLPVQITVTPAELETIIEAVYFLADEAPVDAERRQELNALADRLGQPEPTVPGSEEKKQ